MKTTFSTFTTAVIYASLIASSTKKEEMAPMPKAMPNDHAELPKLASTYKAVQAVQRKFNLNYPKHQKKEDSHQHYLPKRGLGR